MPPAAGSSARSRWAAHPWKVAFDGSHIWVTNQQSGTASEITDTPSPHVTHTVAVGKYPYGIVFVGSHIWLTNPNGAS
ncbi:MAG TPA: hypothetical protein VG815_08935 [Chloroflexota bacterium]|jgi:YVTN family beta-propeller protein|nr:hypothetical protein [Chloroflexota bacterium]